MTGEAVALNHEFSRMPDHDPGLHFVVQMALRNALKLVRGLRKQISEAEERYVVYSRWVGKSVSRTRGQ